MLTPEQAEFACQKFIEWLHFCSDNGLPQPRTVDISHSALLRRLLQGKPALPAPPPLRFSYPAWELVEADEIKIVEMWEDGNGNVVIDQHRGYTWDEKFKNTIIYKRLNLKFQLVERQVIDKGIAYTEKVLIRLRGTTAC